MDGPVPLSDSRASQLAKELTRARQRGLDQLDTAHPGPLALPQLEALARRYLRDELSSRIALIGQLLDDALTAWAAVEQGQHAGDAALVRALFLPPADARAAARDPSTLRRAYMRSHGLTEDKMDKRRQAAFDRFADFLLAFAEKAERPAKTEPPPRRRRRWLAVGVVLVIAAMSIVLWLTGTTSGPDRSPGVPGETTSHAAGVRFTFDDLLGGTAVIRVFAGVHDSPADRVATGTFFGGQTTTAICQTTGRLVRSDPSAGERARTSDVWLQVLAQPGRPSYASLTYGAIAAAALAQLPACHSVA